MPKLEATGELILLTGESRPRPSAAASLSPCEAGPEASLVEAARRGDADSFDRLYRIYAPMVHGLLLARVPGKEVDDLVQDVFITAYTRIESLREVGAFGGWLAMIARNKAHDYHRRRQRQCREDEALSDDLGARDNSAATEAHEILALIRTLPEAYRETLILRFVEGMSGPEIAARCGLTPPSVRVNLSRGMKLLREKLRGGGQQ